jgi:hypothetical protein
MRKALVGIAAALILTTLVIAIVPAWGAQPVYVFFDPKAYVTLQLDLVTTPYPHYIFRLYSEYPVCDGVGGVIVAGGTVTILGRCVNLLPNKGVLSGGGKLTGPVVLLLTVAGKPPVFMKFIMWPAP